MHRYFLLILSTLFLFHTQILANISTKKQKSTFSKPIVSSYLGNLNDTLDSNGNMTSDGIYTYKLDAFNRIIEAHDGTGIKVEYTYDAFNRRVRKDVDTTGNNSLDTKTTFLYDGFRVIEELDDSDALAMEYVHGAMYIDEIILQDDQTTVYYFTHDYRYSTTTLLDTSKNVVESYDYKVYGERTASGSGLTEMGYTGRRHDSETELMYFRNRYYSPVRGSFVTRDPLGYVDGYSMYLGYFGKQGRDPFGNYNENEVGQTKRYRYTCNCGWIDVTGHVENYAMKTKKLYEQMKQLQYGGYFDDRSYQIDFVAAVPGATKWTSDVVTNRFTIPQFNDSNFEETIYKLVYAAGYQEEVDQGSWPVAWFWTAFMWEDITSDMIGAMVGIEMAKNKLSYAAALKKVLNNCDMVTDAEMKRINNANSLGSLKSADQSACKDLGICKGRKGKYAEFEKVKKIADGTTPALKSKRVPNAK